MEPLGWRIQSLLSGDGRCILLIRNPYESIVSFWNHRENNPAKTIDSPNRHIRTDLELSQFREFADREAE